MSIFDPILDGTIYYSFDASGYRRHSKGFVSDDLEVSMAGRVCVVTGANSGLGFELARGLADRGAVLYMMCRNAERGAAAQAKIVALTGNTQVHVTLADLSSPVSIREAVERFPEPKIDVLVHNAGLLPKERVMTSEGFELTVATHVLGPHLLTRLLQSRLEGGRLIWVSSGGMYAKRFSLESMLNNAGSYDGVAAYAMTKRAQVILNELWAEALGKQRVAVHAMHPGWAATPGVESSLPSFWKRMKERLRTPAEGADTALWLSVVHTIPGQSGCFWFDRRPVRTHLVPWTRERQTQRAALWDFCEQHTLP